VIIALQLLVALVGLLMYVLATNPKVVEMGRILFACGVLSFLLEGSSKLITLLPH
jgi:hypothetical protein